MNDATAPATGDAFLEEPPLKLLVGTVLQPLQSGPFPNFVCHKYRVLLLSYLLLR